MFARRQTILGILVGLLAMFVASTFSTWLPIALISLLAVAIVWRREQRGRNAEVSEIRQPRPRWQRWSLMVVALIFVSGLAFVWRLGDHFGESINPILVGIDVLSHVSILMLWLLWTVKPRQGHVSMLLFGLLIVLLCVAAGGTSRTIAVQTTVGLASCIGFLLASQTILSGTSESGRSPVAGLAVWEGRSRRLANLFSLLALTLILMATSAIASVTNRVLPGLQDNLYESLKSTLDSVQSDSLIGGTRYVRGSDLGSVRKHILGDPEEVALRIHADRAPGYLRGTVFDDYDRRRWFTASTSMRQRPAAMANRAVTAQSRGRVELQSQSGRAPSRYYLYPKRDEPLITLEIENDPVKGNLVFLPLGTRALEASGHDLSVNHHGIVRNGVDTRFPYVALIGSGTRPESLDRTVERHLLRIPENLQPLAGQIARSVTNPRASARGKAEAIAKYFQTEYSYSLNVSDPPRGVDPLLHFLRVKHPAHCEFFASASVMLLRSVGVPCRYVTGYVSTEYSDESLYWLARNRDAHAWVEAYDEATGAWFAVESTPGRVYRTVDPNQLDQGGEEGDLSAANRSDADEQTMVGQTFGWLFSIRATDPLVILFRYAQLPLFCVLVFLLWWRFWRSADGRAEPIDMQSRRMLRQADRICRRHHLIRKPHETLHDFAARIEHGLARSLESDATNESMPIVNDDDRNRLRQHPRPSAAVDQLGAVARWYREYANARYQDRLPLSLKASRDRVTAH